MKIWLIHNTGAGHPLWKSQVKQLAEHLTRCGHLTHLVQTDIPASISKLARQAVVEGAEVVLAAGGDGTAGTIAAGLSGTGIALGVIPIGTANLWARQLGMVPPDPWTAGALEHAADSLLRGEVRAIDLGFCEGRPFLTWAGVGLDAFILRRVGTRSWLARQAGLLYLAAASAFHGQRWRGVEMCITTDTGQILEGHHLLAIATSIPRFAGGLVTLSPHTRLDDGLLDVWAFSGRSPWETLGHVRRLALGEPLEPPHVHHLTGSRIEIHTPNVPEVHADGEMLTVVSPVILFVRHAALQILLPASAPASLFVP